MSEENQEQIDYWNNRAGKTWTELQERTDELLHPFSQEVIAVAEIKPNERVLDVGCGCGATSLAISELGAAVTGVDVSMPMLDLAKKRAKRLGLSKLMHPPINQTKNLTLCSLVLVSCFSQIPTRLFQIYTRSQPTMEDSLLCVGSLLRKIRGWLFLDR